MCIVNVFINRPNISYAIYFWSALFKNRIGTIFITEKNQRAGCQILSFTYIHLDGGVNAEKLYGPELNPKSRI